MKQLNDTQETLLFVLGAVALASLLLGFVAFTRPLTQTVIETRLYEHRGKFTYSAAAPSGVYDTNSVETGDPIFSQLTHQVQINFEYELDSEAATNVSGTYRLVAELSDDVNGWKRSVELRPRTAFTGRGFAVSGTLDLEKFQKLVQSLSQATGVARQQYTLTVIPEAQVAGQIEGQAFNDRFAPRLEFRVADLEMYLAPKSPGESGDPLKPMQTGLIERASTQPNTIPIFSFNLNVGLARGLAVAGLLAALSGLVMVWAIPMTAARKGETALIRARYGAMLVAAEGDAFARHRHLIEVGSIDDLAKLAEREGRLIVQAAGDGVDQYFVSEGEVVYRYQLKNQPSGASFIITPEQEAVVEGWLRVLAASKREDRERITQLADLTVRLARRLGLAEPDLVYVRWGALLHDVGKIAIPDHILWKTEPLNENDWQVIHASPAYAQEMLAPHQYLHPALEIPYCHHEKWDGTGYPRGLSGDAIPLSARIFSVVDTWDAMRSDRPYRPRFSDEQVTAYLLEQSGQHFDPQVVQVFLEEIRA